MKRGLTHAEAMEYVGVKRRTFDEAWRPRLVAMRQGSCLIFDRADLDRLFEEFKAHASGSDDASAANDEPIAQNGPRNGWPKPERGVTKWAKKHGASTPEIAKERGKSTSGGGVPDFASVALAVLKKRNAG